MLSLVANLPQLQTLLQAPASLSSQRLAADAVSEISRLTTPEDQSLAGLAVLKALKARGDAGVQDFVERALEVMQKFPHFARPRAAVALRALSALSKM